MMTKEIASLSDIKIGDTIKSKKNWHLSGTVTSIDEHYVRYKSIITGLIQPIHISNIINYIIIS